jgi:hypothetical protein
LISAITEDSGEPSDVFGSVYLIVKANIKVIDLMEIDL